MNREEFEKLPEIAERIKRSEAFYCPKGNWYLSPHEDCREDEAFLDGAWYAWQEQQQKIDDLNLKIQDLISKYEGKTTLPILDHWSDCFVKSARGTVNDLKELLK